MKEEKKEKWQEALALMKKDLRTWGRGILVAAAFVLAMQLLFGQACPMVLFTGIPCPGCGITRSITLLVFGYFKEAIEMYPMVLPIGIWVALFGLNRYYIKKGMHILKICGILILLSSIGVYIYRMINWYPDRVPMVYYEMNLHSMLKKMCY